MDLGASRRGVDMGPSAIRVARLGPRLEELGHKVIDSGNVQVGVAESIGPGEEKARYLTQIAKTCTQLSKTVYDSFKASNTPLVLGGDHSIAVGTIAGVSRFFQEQEKKIGLIWIDAHADINTPETSLSGNIHGMPLAAVLGHGAHKLVSLAGHIPMVAASQSVLIGIRDLDPAERDMIKKVGLRAFTMREIDEIGLRKVMEEAIRIATQGTVGFHCSMDVDWLDPSVAPGVGTPARGGGTYREGHLAMEMIYDSQKMLSLEVTEVNPVLDHENDTAKAAADMVLSAFGKKIL